MKEKIKDYLIELLDYLDGNGLVITDSDLIAEVLEEMGDFKALQNIIKEEN